MAHNAYMSNVLEYQFEFFMKVFPEKEASLDILNAVNNGDEWQEEFSGTLNQEEYRIFKAAWLKQKANADATLPKVNSYLEKEGVFEVIASRFCEMFENNVDIKKAESVFLEIAPICISDAHRAKIIEIQKEQEAK